MHRHGPRASMNQVAKRENKPYPKHQRIGRTKALELPPQVQSLVDAVSALPGVAACFCGPKPLAEFDPSHLSLPGEYGSFPQAIIMRTNGGRANEVMIQTEVILDRSLDAWLSLEFLAWWVRDWGRSGHEIQMRVMTLLGEGPCCGGEYFIHGFGCALRLPDRSVDFDFGDDGQIDGFDWSRLLSFAGPRLFKP